MANGVSTTIHPVETDRKVHLVCAIKCEYWIFFLINFMRVFYSIFSEYIYIGISIRKCGTIVAKKFFMSQKHLTNQFLLLNFPTVTQLFSCHLIMCVIPKVLFYKLMPKHQDLEQNFPARLQFHNSSLQRKRKKN